MRKPDPESIKERITDDQGREISFIRPNGDKLKSHFINITAKDNDDNYAIKIKQLKAKKKKDKVVLDSILELEPHLPGQDDAFEGQPMLKEYYHKIEPTASRLS